MPPEEQPGIKAPTAFNHSFESPTKVWRVSGGFLASFDKGEFGGALFFAQHGAKRWTLILRSHIQNLADIGGDTYVATGGLAHLSYVVGQAYVLSRNSKGKWNVKLIFQTGLGVPVIVGTTITKPDFEDEGGRLIVIGLEPPVARRPLFGISKQGAVHYLGETTDTKSKGGDKSQPESKGRTR